MKNEIILECSRRQQGITLIELLVSIGLLVVIAGFFVNQRVEAVKLQRAESLAQELMTVSAISASYHIDQRSWPDETNDCQDLLRDLRNANVFPAGYTHFDGLTFASDCRVAASGPTSNFGRILRLTLTFPYADREYAAMVASIVPASNLDVPAPTSSNPAPNVTVEHYLFASRRHSLPPFELVTLDTNGMIEFERPRCGHGSPRVILVPQAICLDNAHGLGGFYFREVTTVPRWRFELNVRSGNHPSYREMDVACIPSGRREVGVITYCE